jgi:hypothetical protein
MDVKDAVPAAVVFHGFRFEAVDSIPKDEMVVVRPVFDIFGHLDFAATVNNSIHFLNVGSA